MRKDIKPIAAIADKQERDLAAVRAWKMDPDLRGEFVAFARFLTYVEGVASGRINHGRDQAASPISYDAEGVPSDLPLEERARLTWQRAATVRREFSNHFGAYLVYRQQAEQLGNTAPWPGTDGQAKAFALELWHADADLRGEFRGDFASWASYAAACIDGRMRGADAGRVAVQFDAWQRRKAERAG